MIADTGSTGHFVQVTARPHDIHTADTPITILLPDGSSITSTHTGTLDIPDLPLPARVCHIFPALTTGSLLSISQLCDYGCQATFTAHQLHITHRSNVILTGTRTNTHGHWIVNVPTAHSANTQPQPLNPMSPLPHTANAILHANTRVADKIAFYHAALFSPCLSTWCAAIDAGHLTSWPDLTSAQVRKHAPISIAMHMGHMDQIRANTNSTRPNPPPALHPAPPPTRTHSIYVDCHDITGQIYTDQTGRFLTPSSGGHSYLLVLYDYDSNYIHAEPLRSRSGPDILEGYRAVTDLLTKRGLRPQLQRLDNEASGALQAHMEDIQVDFQLTPPHVHRRNAAERAIRTFKNHFVAGLCSTDPTFPLHQWHRLLPQALLTLNLLRTSRLHPHLSAQAHVHGPFDFNRTPIAPPGQKVLIHEKPTVRPSWAPHAVAGWYLGPALRHYRCYRVWCRDTAAERVTDTLSWLPAHVRMPVPSRTDAVHSAAQDLIKALRQPPTPNATITHLQTPTKVALQQLATIFANHAPPGSPAPTPPTTRPSATPNAPLGSPAPTPPATRPSAPPNQPPTAEPHNNPPEEPRVTPTVTSTVPPTEPPTPPRVPTGTPTSAPAPPHPKTRQQSRGRMLTFNPRTHAPAPTPAATRTQHSANAVLDTTTGASLNYHQLLKGPDRDAWLQGAANEIGRLAQGVLPHMPTGTETMHFIPHSALPAGRTATYLRIVAELKPHKAEKHRVRFTVGGNRIQYPGKVSTPTADLTTAKLLFNSIVSTPGAKFAAFDISNFYLNNPMTRFEYMRIPLRDIPPTIIQQYQLTSLVHRDHVLVEIRKGMYGLPQAGIIAHDRLKAHLATWGYHATPHTPGLFRHESRPITFCLVVDDFGIKYVGREHAQHLLDCLETIYTVTTDWNGTKFCGLTLNWNYHQRTVDISMPGYVAKALHRFQHKPPSRPQHAPHPWTAPTYSSAPQLTPPIDTSPLLDPADRLRLQEIIGVLLFYARAVDCTMLVALSSLAASKTTHATAQAVTHLLNYATTHPDAVLRYHASDMTLHVHSDASYLSEPQSRSRAGGYFFLSTNDPQHTTNPNPDAPPPPTNGNVHIPCTIMKVVVASAAEAELGALFHNAKDAAWLRSTLHDMGHTQPPTPIQTDNACAAGICNDTVKQRRSKAIDMRFYWVRDRINQRQFVVHWRRGTDNLADYFTKHHPPSHHRLMRSRYLLEIHRPIPATTGPPSQPLAAPALIRASEGVLMDTTATYGQDPSVELATDSASQARSARCLGTTQPSALQPARDIDNS